MRIGCCQLPCLPGEPEKNLQEAKTAVLRAAEAGAEVILLPEAWLTGFQMDEIQRWTAMAEEARGSLRAVLNGWEGYLASGSLFVEDQGRLFNEMQVHRGEDLVAHCRKLHLFGALGEDQCLTPGEEIATAQLGEHTAGLAICYDLRFPEIFRRQTMGGAELFLLPAQWPHPRIVHWRLLAQARAVENLAFMVALNASGTPDINRLYGHSMVVAPWGEILWEPEQESVVAVIDLDLSRVAEARAALPSVADMREDLW